MGKRGREKGMQEGDGEGRGVKHWHGEMGREGVGRMEAGGGEGREIGNEGI